jgi:hypothetical protein
MNYKAFLYQASLLLLVACSPAAEEYVAPASADAQPLLLSAAPAAATPTRAADGLYTASTGFDGTETVRVFLADKHADYHVGTADANHNYRSALSPVTSRLYYPAGTTGEVTVYGVYPATSALTHTVAYDQTTAAGYKASDLMYTRKVVPLASKSTSQTLAFDHQLVKVKFVVKKAADVQQLTKIELKNVKRQATVTADATSLSLSGLTSATGDDAAQGDNILISGTITDTNPHTCVVLFPKQAWDDADFIEATDGNNKTATWQLTKSDWTPGAEYTMTFTVDGASLGLTASITDWTPDGHIITVLRNRLVIDDIPEQHYTGQPIEPTPDVYYNGQLLTLGTDYYFKYSGNTFQGTATIIAIGLNDYVGKTTTATFQIVP